MDLLRKIQDLREQKEKLKRVIASFKALENVVNEAALHAADRKAASARMKRSWAGKRKQGQPPNPEPIVR
jgi:DNA invertase Pin-like site-specific DNA recombinase